MKSTQIHEDIFTGLGIIVFGIVFLFFSRNISGDAALFPRYLLIIMIFIGIWIGISGFKKQTAAMKKNVPVKNRLTWDTIKYPAGAFLMLLIYGLLFFLAGYMIASIFFMVVLMRYLHVKSWRFIIILSLGFLVFVYVVFYLNFHIRIISFGQMGFYLGI
jgi:hypothetical protein